MQTIYEFYSWKIVKSFSSCCKLLTGLADIFNLIIFAKLLIINQFTVIMSNQSPEFHCRATGCGKSYSSKYNLRRHIESNHCKNKRFRCRACGKYLSSRQNLQEHMHTHTRVKPYICREIHCGKSFRQSSQLSNHKKLHKELQSLFRQQSHFKELKVTTI